MTYLMERMIKLKKKLNKSKKHGKKCSRDLSDSDSDSDQDSGSGSKGNLADKHLKLEQPNLESTDTCPIKAAKLALDITRLKTQKQTK